MNPLYQYDTLPTTSAAAIREFKDTLLAVMGASKPDGWADKMGALIPTKAPMVTFPISQLGTRYTEARGESRFKSMGEKSFDIKSSEFQAGYQAKLLDLFQEAFAYRRWQEAPGRFLLAEENFRHSRIATLLEAGESTALYDGSVGVNFFSASHPCNLFESVDTFSNYQSSTKDVVSITNLQAEVVLMMNGVKDEDGKKLGVRPDTILVPLEKAEPLKNLLKQNMIADANNVSVTNPYMNGFNVVPVREFTDANDWYLVDSKMIAQGYAPWLALRQDVPGSLSLRTWDESTDFFRDTSHIKVASHIWYGFALGMPHAIRKVKGA